IATTLRSVNSSNPVLWALIQTTLVARMSSFAAKPTGPWPYRASELMALA
ncbi:MAG: hypothetical protein JWM51_2248, partial [Microbacteriaceae bacterium]|nr:hypothetical protein [Microbacteriaceae bacterium]